MENIWRTYGEMHQGFLYGFILFQDVNMVQTCTEHNLSVSMCNRVYLICTPPPLPTP